MSVSYPNFGGSRVTSRCFWEKVVQGSLDGANIINLREEERLAVFDLVYDDIYGTGGANTYDVYPDVRPFLERAKKRGIVIGAVTNADERYRTLVLPSLGLSDAMDFVITSKEFGIEKLVSMSPEDILNNARQDIVLVDLLPHSLNIPRPCWG